jgi:hypothetical protein
MEYGHGSTAHQRIRDGQADRTGPVPPSVNQLECAGFEGHRAAEIDGDALGSRPTWLAASNGHALGRDQPRNWWRVRGYAGDGRAVIESDIENTTGDYRWCVGWPTRQIAKMADVDIMN